MMPCLRSIPHTVPDVPPPCGLTKDIVIFARPAAVRWTAVVLAPVPVAGETSILLQGCRHLHVCVSGLFSVLSSLLVRSFLGSVLPTSILQVTVSIWFTDDYAGVGQAGQPGLCPPAHGTEYTCREWRGMYLLTLEPL